MFHVARPVKSRHFQRGLRTLVIAYKKMDQSEYENLSQDVEEARQVIGSERAIQMARAYDRIESGLTLLGVTAVEDRLQEDVQETLECLRVAGIKVGLSYGSSIDRTKPKTLSSR